MADFCSRCWERDGFPMPLSRQILEYGICEGCGVIKLVVVGRRRLPSIIPYIQVRKDNKRGCDNGAAHDTRR